MTTYKDMTFCGFYKECEKGLFCDRRLSPTVKLKAHQLGLPIAEYKDKPKCFEERISKRKVKQ